MELDGYKLVWRELAAVGLPINSYKFMAVKLPFHRNFIQDSWDFSKEVDECLIMDQRWICNANMELVSDYKIKIIVLL
jgi:hypothetical protein